MPLAGVGHRDLHLAAVTVVAVTSTRPLGGEWRRALPEQVGQHFADAVGIGR